MMSVDKFVIAVPLQDGKLTQHFGHCPEFGLYVVDRDEKKILEQKLVPAPPHEPGKLPPWLAEQGAKIVLAGGIGSRAVQLFAQSGIEVISGCPLGAPEDVVREYLEGKLSAGGNLCDH